jgi:hypothetical protein
MITKAGIGGFGDNVTKDEAREDAAVFETEGISKTEHDISEPRKKQRRREGGNRGGKQIWTSNAFGNNQPSDNVSNLRIWQVTFIAYTNIWDSNANAHGRDNNENGGKRENLTWFFNFLVPAA